MEAGMQDIESRPSLASCGTAPPCVGQPGKAPNTHHTLDRNIFFKNLLPASQSTSKKSPIAMHCSPKPGWSRQPRAAHCAAPLCKKGLCATGADQSEWRQSGKGRSKGGSSKAHPQSALAATIATCSAVAEPA